MSAIVEEVPQHLRPRRMARLLGGVAVDVLAAILGAVLVLGVVGTNADGCPGQAHGAELHTRHGGG